MADHERWRVAVVAVVVTWFFFFEYIPPFKRVHFVWDTQGFHYPLLDYAFRSLSRGRLPEWDPSLYCGLSFVGNVQAALFYPPNWLLFAVNLGRPRLPFKSLELLVVAHFWLAFVLCYLWMRGKRLAILPSALGSAVFAYSGYMVSQIQHVGVVTGCAWIPLGLWGVEEAAETRDWRRLWKLAIASGLCFLAGYPPAWFVFCILVMTYAAALRRGWMITCASGIALAASLLLVMVQLLPVMEAATMMVRDLKYQGGAFGGKFYLSYFVPNFFDVGRSSIAGADPTRQYFYLGIPVFFGLGWLIGARNWGRHLPALAIGCVSLAAFSNPLGLLGAFVNQFPLLSQICRDWNFLAGLTLAGSLLAATALDDFLQRGPGAKAGWLAPVAACALAAWSLRQWFIWLPGGSDFASGWRSAMDPLITLALFSLGIYAWRGQQGTQRTALGLALLVAVAVDYKVFGTSKLFNSEPGDVDQLYAGRQFPNLDDALYRELRSRPEFRITIEPTGPFPTELRPAGLSTPQGFDPMLPAQYKQLIEPYTAFRSDRLFEIDPANERLLQLLAVRYVWTDRNSPLYPALSASPNFRLLEPSSGFSLVFEYLKAVPAYRWSGLGSIECNLWTPEKREFVAPSPAGGRFVLIEQFFPGWRATVDGRPVPIERWQGAFQAIAVEPGEHRIRFEFRSLGLRVGAAVSLLALFGIWAVARRRRPG